jgi:hypothetical protein
VLLPKSSCLGRCSQRTPAVQTMQTLVHVYCWQGPSLRERIAKDRKLESFKLQVVKEQKPGRRPGWLKLHSNTPDRRGAINLQWDASGLLRCRVVNRGSGKPSSIIGDFVEYVLARHRKRVRTITIVPD